jgi:Zn-dependent peptidase ImmA (M78 family)
MIHLYLDREIRPYTYYIQDVIGRLGLTDETADILFTYGNLEEELNGYCTGDSDFIEIYINDGLNETELLKTLAHELVHAKQLVFKQEYSEQEAYALEETLYKLFWSEKKNASTINNVV